VKNNNNNNGNNNKSVANGENGLIMKDNEKPITIIIMKEDNGNINDERMTLILKMPINDAYYVY